MRLILCLIVGCGLLACLVAGSTSAQAANQITGGCSASSTGIVFPNYDLVNKTQQTSTGTVLVQCTGTGTVSVQVALTTGSGTCATRTMTSGANSISYNIYTTSGYATVWCDPTTRVSTTFTFSHPTIPSTLTNSVTMYARVPAGQSVSVGTYSASVGALVYWTGGNSATSTFAVTESAPATCSSSVGSLAFGTYAGASRNAQSTLSLTCSSGTAYTIALSTGSNFSGGTRRMKSAVNQFINYALYSDSARLVPWGTGASGGSTVGGSGTGSAQSLTIYGTAPAATVPSPGSYSDSVVVTVTY